MSEPSLPSQEEYNRGLDHIWATRSLTNSGYYQRELEKNLAQFLNIENITLFCNGTLGLFLGLKALGLKGEVITTPFTFVATSVAIQWAGLTPVYVDIEENGVNISPKAIEEAITEKTSAILAVHCYGNICDTEAIEKIATKYNLKVIYDAAHSFATEDIQGKSVLSHGDLSMTSFHATKVFHTIEGGAIVCKTPEMKKQLDALANFGAIEGLDVNYGLNAKLHEFSSLMGLLNLKNLERIISKRKLIFDTYVSELETFKNIKILNSHKGLRKMNYPYMAVRMPTSLREKVFDALAEKKIYARKYFVPLVSNMVPGRKADNLVHAQALCDEVLCLPLHENMEVSDVKRVVTILKQVGL